MKLIAFSLCLPLVALGCGSSAKETPTSATVRGTLALSTFSTTPTGVQAIDEKGATIRGNLAADGSFSLVLPKDHTYRLVLTTASALEPIVFPRSTGKLDTTFRLSGGGAAIPLGSVKHYDSAPAGGFVSVGTTKQLLSSDPAPPEGAEGAEGDVECVDGVVEETGAVCVDDDAEGEDMCEAEGGDGDGEIDDDGPEGAAGSAAETEEDGECEDGIDAETGAACVDDDADPTGAMAVPEHNAPDDVAGCEEEGEEEDDD